MVLIMREDEGDLQPVEQEIVVIMMKAVAYGGIEACQVVLGKTLPRPF